MRSRPARLGRRDGDTRARVRSAAYSGPVWPTAFDLARSGIPIGAWVALSAEAALWVVVVVDGDGQLLEVTRKPRRQALRWCTLRHLRVFPVLGQLLDAVLAGVVLGWLPDRVFEISSNGGTFFPPAAPLGCDVGRLSAPVVDAMADLVDLAELV